ncbi:hypothetical protein TCAL_06672 [Tigriopus californicus]|uniref:RRM domain-containing protein n=1 Tax=Tigriopus californicus TaxID=6832 RepID=A0A553N8A0_TIGCA|nr:RNA-binding protein 28-like [Tigriopus californicus]TRY61643.1 hypothetical protein TCAL_06672 [Tigriopus californicus]|eukprot:TCALIF_06672-PA protein Name:"Similar to Rbm28 RNA-binding protein 28 (Mus musculus)" AED:0.32 eAED:0.32 QI:0/-1/0/1/-1/1/1/0/624
MATTKDDKRGPAASAPASAGSRAHSRQAFAQLEENRQFAHKRKARLIVRNISFKTVESDLEQHFAQFQGQVVEAKILKKPDGKMVGCAFVQMASVAQAAKVIKELNGKPMLGRPVAVDWAVDKRTFQERGPAPIPTPVACQDEPDEKPIKVEIKDEPEEAEEMKNEEEDDDNDEGNSEDDNEEDEDSGEEREAKPWHGLSHGHDINENKTVFLRNLSFDSDEMGLRELMETEFGAVIFVKLVIDKMTENPKGTAFVKFHNPEHAEKLLAMSDTPDGIHLDGRRIFAVKALAKDNVDQVQKEKKAKEKKDTRNLHLAVEGLIRKGTRAAQGVSEADMTKRTQVDRWKRGILKDLNMFVSPFRLCVRNLPPDFSDMKLKKLFVKHATPKAGITESKIIRDMTKLDKDGLGKSKGYGFVTFKSHEDALNALRKVNNNPKCFLKDARPIVEFSVENRKAVNAREKRLQKSRDNNPLYHKNQDGSGGKLQFKKKNKKDVLEDKEEFMGSIHDPKQRNLPSHTGEKIRHNRKAAPISRKDIKKMEKDKKNPKKRKIRTIVEDKPTFNEHSQAQTDDGQPKAKKAKKNKKGKGKKPADAKDEKQFDSLVNQYRAKLNSAASNVETKRKWFD